MREGSPAFPSREEEGRREGEGWLSLTSSVSVEGQTCYFFFLPVVFLASPFFAPAFLSVEAGAFLSAAVAPFLASAFPSAFLASPFFASPFFASATPAALCGR